MQPRRVSSTALARIPAALQDNAIFAGHSRDVLGKMSGEVAREQRGSRQLRAQNNRRRERSFHICVRAVALLILGSAAPSAFALS